MKINAKNRIIAASYDKKDIEDMLRFIESYSNLQSHEYDVGNKTKMACFLTLFDVDLKDIENYICDNIDFANDYNIESVNDVLDTIDAAFHRDYHYFLYHIVYLYPAIARNIYKRFQD